MIVGSRPWIIFPGLIVLALWAISVYLSWAGRERGLANDLILVLLAAISPILMYQVAKDESSLGVIPKSIWITSMVSLLFFIGSVLHVKALIRESKDPRWHVSSILFHIIALLGLVMITGSWALAIPFALALVRTVFMKPGLRPGRIGIVEAVVAVALVIGTVVGQS